jgi:hypothetical protein
MHAALLCKSTHLSRSSLDCDASSCADKQNFSPRVIKTLSEQPDMVVKTLYPATYNTHRLHK